MSGRLHHQGQSRICSVQPHLRATGEQVGDNLSNEITTTTQILLRRVFATYLFHVRITQQVD